MVRVYSKAMTFLWEQDSGPLSMGWVRLGLDPSLRSGMSNGLYYLSLAPKRQGVRGATLIVKIMVIH
jgi:hypothetical protein